MNYKNMQIKVIDLDHLKKVRDALEQLGFWFNMDDGDNSRAKWVIATSEHYDIYNNDRASGEWCVTTTLNDLLEMCSNLEN